MKPNERRERLHRAQLYLCTGIRDGGKNLGRFLDAVLGAGVDVVQMREKHAEARAQLDAAVVFRTMCARHDALFIVNDRADLAAAAESDGVHVGQEDLSPEAARALLGPDAIVGRSTHSPDELVRALREPVDYLGVGPVHPTPTKPGRPGVGLNYVRTAASMANLPWFVTGGMDAMTIPAAAEAGALRFVVVRAITEAPDPALAVKEIRSGFPSLDTRERAARADTAPPSDARRSS
jgi:thiamine-phosphate pyrophosphorylase